MCACRCTPFAWRPARSGWTPDRRPGKRLPELQIDGSWHGLFAPARMPASLVARLEGEVRRAIATPEVRERFVKLGLIPVWSTSAEFRTFVANAVQRFGEAARVAGLKPE